MSTLMECPISTCDWTLERDDELNARNVAMSPQVAAALGTPLDAFLSIREHQLRVGYERDLERHLAKHPVLDWVTDLVAARTLLTTERTATLTKAIAAISEAPANEFEGPAIRSAQRILRALIPTPAAPATVTPTEETTS